MRCFSFCSAMSLCSDSVMELKDDPSEASWSCERTSMRWVKSPWLICCVASYRLATDKVMVRVRRTPMTRATISIRAKTSAINTSRTTMAEVISPSVRKSLP